MLYQIISIIGALLVLVAFAAQQSRHLHVDSPTYQLMNLFGGLLLRDAKVSVMTHAFNYGTGVFEGIRAYWNADDQQLYALHLKEHYLRLHRSCRSRG